MHIESDRVRELEANGFKLAKEYDELPWQHMMFFARDEKWEAPEDYRPNQ